MEELNIILNEDENKLIEQFKKIQQQNELVDSYPSSFAKNINGKIHKLCVKIFREQIIPYIEKNPGCKQSILKRRVPNAIRDNISLFLYISAKNNLIKRTKAGRSYGLFLNCEINQIKPSLASLTHSASERPPSQVRCEIYHNCKHRIVEYFGEDTLEIFKGCYPYLDLSEIGDGLDFEMNNVLERILDK